MSKLEKTKHHGKIGRMSDKSGMGFSTEQETEALKHPHVIRQEYSSAAFRWSQRKFVIVMSMMTEILDLEGVQKRCPPKENQH